MNHRLATDFFVGRHAELCVLDDALAAAHAGNPQSVLVTGEAGIGKTALVERFLARSTGVMTLRATAVESETTLSYGIVDQWLQAEGTMLTGASLLSAGVRLLEVIDAAETTVLVLDDAQWADEASLATLVFVVRRLQADNALVIVTAREGAVPLGLERLAMTPIRLGPLGLSDLEQLAAAAGLANPARPARRLLHHTGGNPLYARALLDEVPAGHWERPGVTLPAPRPFAAMVRSRLDRLAPDARALVEAVAVLGAGHSLATAAVVAGVSEDHDALEAAQEAGLLVTGDPYELAFAHSLTAAAVLDGLGQGRRARLHLAAAQALDDPGRALIHRAAAASGPDAQLAAEFEALAEQLARRPARLEAAEALLSASRLTPDRALRDERLLRALDWMGEAGDVSAVEAFETQVRALPRSARRDGILATLAFSSGHSEDAAQWLASAWAACDPDADPALAARIAHRSGFLALMGLDDAEVATWAQRSRALASDDIIGVEATAMLALAWWRLGRREEAYALLEESLTADADLDAELRGTRGWLRCADDDLVRGVRDLTAAIHAEVRAGTLHVATSHLAALSRAHYALGAWDDAVLAAERAVALSAELGDSPHRSFVWWAAVAVPAARGDQDLVEAALAGAAREPLDVPDRLVAVGMTRALAAAAQGDHATVARALEAVAQLPARECVGAPGFWPWQDLYADALIALDRDGEAEAFLDFHEALARESNSASMIAKLLRSRGRLAAKQRRPTAARAAFTEALEQITPLGMRYEQALLQLAFGQFLRRQRQRTAAVAQFTSASHTLSALGARPALERCARELEACGIGGVRHRPGLANLLTPQEQVVARLAAKGRTNRELAAELLLSPKTVEVHLTRIYAKLGVASRTQLAARLDAA